MGRIATNAPDVDSILRFLRGQNPLRPSSFGKNIRSNVAPALTPRDRQSVDDWYKKHAHTDKAVEEAEAADKQAEMDGDIPTTLLEAQIGRPMHRKDIIKRLSKLNPNFYFERSISFPDIMGIYVPDDHATLRDGRRVRHVVGFEFGYSPEFTVYHPTAKATRKVPYAKKVTRGWRALILMLSQRGYISFNDACKAFNITGTARKKWHDEVTRMKRPR